MGEALQTSRRDLLAAGLIGTLASTLEFGIAQGEQRKGSPMQKIQVGGSQVTLVNVFTVEPENQARLAEILQSGTEEFFSKQPGSVSSSILKGRDGRKVVNYSQWRSLSDISAFRELPYFNKYIESINELAKTETLLGDVVFVHGVE